MSLRFEITKKVLHFKEPAGTSRGVYTTRTSWFVTCTDSESCKKGVGECAPLPDLSCDYCENYYDVLRDFCNIIEETGSVPYDALKDYPSMLFGIECAMLGAEKTSSTLFDTAFSRGEKGITINGLVWMGDHQTMLKRLASKLEQGYRCVKLKIGAIDFNDELSLIKHIRNTFTNDDVELRVDANGAFSVTEAVEKLNKLAQYDIHSIEQPIRQGQWQQMAQLCSLNIIPIALDEELIGVNSTSKKIELLDTIKPAFIILKPSLHGGISGCSEWKQLADERKIGSWATSALESNIGLNAVAQFAAHLYNNDDIMPQGLGTGQLFTDNIEMPLKIIGDKLWIVNDNR